MLLCKKSFCKMIARINLIQAKKIHDQLNGTISELKVNNVLEQKSFNTALTISYLLFSLAVLYIAVRLLV